MIGDSHTAPGDWLTVEGPPSAKFSDRDQAERIAARLLRAYETQPTKRRRVMPYALVTRGR